MNSPGQGGIELIQRGGGKRTIDIVIQMRDISRVRNIGVTALSEEGGLRVASRSGDTVFHGPDVGRASIGAVQARASLAEAHSEASASGRNWFKRERTKFSQAWLWTPSEPTPMFFKPSSHVWV